MLELDRFSEVDLDRWARLSHDLDKLHSLLYFGFAEQRNTLRKELLASLQAPAFSPFEFRDWVRILPYRYSLTPLSAAGSLIGVGGRFNVGTDVPKSNSPHWPAVYLAADFETAFREKYGLTRAEATSGLAPEELALEKPESITAVRLNGHVERPFDFTDLDALKPFCEVLKRCRMPREVERVAARLKIERKNRPTTVRSPRQLHRTVMASNWRQWPVQFEVPAHGQVLAALLIEAGYEAVLYPSSKSGERCLAMFPCNLASAATFVELAPGYPEQVAHPRLDMESFEALSGMPCG